MKDEVLKKLSNTDSSVIPRYDIILPDGTVFASRVQIVLKNTVLEPGTPLNKANLLSDDTSVALGLDPATSTPDAAFNAIRNSIGFCPKIKVEYFEGGQIHVRNSKNITSKVYNVPSPGEVTIDILEYGVYRIWGVFNGVEESGEDLIVDTTKLYTLNLRKQYHRWMLVTPNSKQASFTVTHSDGFTFTIAQGSSPFIYLPRAGTYTARAVGILDGKPSKAYTLTVTEEDLALKETTVTNMEWPAADEPEEM